MNVVIYTLTFDPALDHIICLSGFNEGGINRVNREIVEVGGTGINISATLSELDVKSRALGFVAGFTGDEIERRLRQRGVETDFVRLESGMSRFNVVMKDYGPDKITETLVSPDGPEIPDEALGQLFMKLGAIADGDVLVLSGGVPNTIRGDIYEQILEYIAGRDIKLVADVQSKQLSPLLSYKPYLIKTDVNELGELCGECPSSMLEAVACAGNLREMGAGNILISMADGAVFLDESGKTLYCGACRGKVKNTLGTSEAMLAGFLSGALDDDTDMEYALILGTAASGAAAFSEGFAKKDDILDQMKQLLKERV